MIKIAITGGIGSGKSYVARLLQERGVPVYVADDESKRLTVSDALIRRLLIELLGPSVYQSDGSLNKPLLAQYLFSDPAHTRQVNAIIHPRVKQDFGEWAARQQAAVVGLESAILYEAGFADTVDAVVMVYAPTELRTERAMARDGASREQIERRMAAQMSDEEKRRRARYVVMNDGSQPLDAQLDALLGQLARDFPTLRHF
jgi:dephospho-CoA kinase